MTAATTHRFLEEPAHAVEAVRCLCASTDICAVSRRTPQQAIDDAFIDLAMDRPRPGHLEEVLP